MIKNKFRDSNQVLNKVQLLRLTSQMHEQNNDVLTYVYIYVFMCVISDKYYILKNKIQFF